MTPGPLPPAAGTSPATPSIASQLAQAVAAVGRSHHALARDLLDDVVRRRQLAGEPHGPAELQLIETLRARCAQHVVPVRSGSTHRVGNGAPVPLPGVSVVTCCMNRTENLLLALPTWLSLPGVDEVVVVDWCSREPVAQSLAQAGIHDPRVHVVRVEDEPRWILSFAFNLGFRMARHALIVKVDADITLKPDFFANNQLRGGTFIAGDWEAADKGQEHINGFFYVHLVDLLRIRGFNEYITSYGWDDDDIYARLVQSGLQRLCVDTRTLYHLPHDDAQRLGGGQGGPDCAWKELHGTTLYKIRTNRFIAMTMPAWTHERQFAPFEMLASEGRVTTVRRLVAQLPHYVSDDLKADAELHAAMEMVSWRVGPQAYHMPKARFRALLERKKLDELSAFDVGVGVDPSDAFDRLRRHNILVDLSGVTEGAGLDALARHILRSTRADDVGVFVLWGSEAARSTLLQHLDGRGTPLGRWVPNQGLRHLGADDLAALGALAITGAGVHLPATTAVLAQARALDTPLLPAARRPRLYIDAQHGLGNRLRAYASAAAVAQATGRDLVLVWIPDHHCECTFGDLFEHDGITVVESPAALPATGLRRITYMELEPGACKDAPIELGPDGDVLVRSAYVLNHPASTWDSENRALRSLRPSARVQGLVDAVPVAGCIGAHVRMEAGKDLDHNSYDAAGNWTQQSHDEIQHWRGKSHYSAFMRRIDALLAADPRRRLFLATDLAENYSVFRNRYGDRMCDLPRTVYDRSREQIVYALADAILLSRCEMLLGSTWSSFSELAMRLSTTYAKIEMSGKDF